MRARQLATLLDFSIKNNFAVLIKGIPGIGKTAIVKQVCKALGVDLIISHPVVDEPTDYKGLPFADMNERVANFLPFGKLKQLLDADKPTVFFIDDLGQAPESVQKALMQLLHGGRIDGHKINTKLITFVAATNGHKDKAGVSGIIETVKSRFKYIVELEPDVDDWTVWALKAKMPTELIAFIRFRPEMLSKFEPTREIINSPCPRTVASIGQVMNAGIPSAIPEFTLFSGAAGETFATEFIGFLTLYKELPTIEEIILNPTTTKVPEEASVLVALSTALGAKMSDTNIAPIMTYLERLPSETAIATMKIATAKSRDICRTRSFIEFTQEYGDIIQL